MAQKIYIGKTEVANLDKVYTKSEINTQLSTKASTQQLANALAAVEHEISDVSSDKQNKLTAGSNITISNDVISSTDTTYSAGTGLSIDANNEISVDTNTIATQLDIATVEEEINALELNKQDELVAGTGITIDGNVISSEGTTYTAGSNISIDDDVISAVDTTYEAGNGLDLTSGAFSIDTTVVATKTDLEDKQNVATLDNDVAALGFSKTHGTLTGITMNSSLVTVENGIANLGTVITDISDKQDTATLETDVAALGFTKNEGTLTGITMNGSSVSVSSGVADLGTVITDISGKQDTLTAGNNISINSNVVSIDSSTATDGQVLTADGLGGATWENISSGTTDYNELNNIPIINQTVTTQVEAFVANETILTSSSIIHFDNSAEGTAALETMMADALVSASYKILLSTSSGTSVSIYSVKSGQSYGLLVLVYSDTDHFYPIYSTAPFTFNGITFNGGWESINEASGNLVLSEITSDSTVSSIVDTDNWNGELIGLGIEIENPIGVQGNYYRRNGSKIYYYDGIKYNELAIGSYLSAVNPTASGSLSINRGSGTVGENSATVGSQNSATGDATFASGSSTTAKGNYSHSEGQNTYAFGKASHAEGRNSFPSSSIYVNSAAYSSSITTTSNDSDIKKGTTLYTSTNSAIINNVTIDTSTNIKTLELSNYLFDTAVSNTRVSLLYRCAIGDYSHSEGYYTYSGGEAAHAEGSNTRAGGQYSHAEGYYTEASGSNSHAEGYYTVASESNSHAEGDHTVAKYSEQHVFGRYNIEDPGKEGYWNAGKYVEIVGNGTYSQKSNARTLDWDGNETVAGTITATGFKTENGTSNDVLKADGSVSSISYSDIENVPITNEKVVENLVSYSVGDIIKNGDKLHFENTGLFYDMIRHMPYDSSTNIATLIDAGQATINVYKNGDYDSKYIVYTGSTVLFVLSSGSGYVEYDGIKYVFGAYALDENNDYTFELSSPETITSIYIPSSEEEEWNGTSICKVQTNLEDSKYYYKDNVGGKLKSQEVNDIIIETIISEYQEFNNIDFSSITHPGPISNSVSLLETKVLPTSTPVSKLYVTEEQDPNAPLNLLDRLLQSISFNSNITISPAEFRSFTYETKRIDYTMYDYLQLATYKPVDTIRQAYELCILHSNGDYYNLFIKPLDDDTTTGTWIYGAVQGWQNTDFRLDQTYGNYYDVENLYQEIITNTTFFETYEIRYDYAWGHTLYSDAGVLWSNSYSAHALQFTPGTISFIADYQSFIPAVGMTISYNKYATVEIDNSTHEINWSTYKVIPYDKLFTNSFNKLPSTISYIDPNYYYYKVRLIGSGADIYQYKDNKSNSLLTEASTKYRHDVFINATVQSTDIAVGFSVYTATEDYNNDFDTLITDLVNIYDNISTNTTDDILANGLYDTSNTPKQVKCVFASTNTPDPSLQVKTWDGSQAGIIVSNITDCYITTVKII